MKTIASISLISLICGSIICILSCSNENNDSSVVKGNGSGSKQKKTATNVKQIREEAPESYVKTKASVNAKTVQTSERTRRKRELRRDGMRLEGSGNPGESILKYREALTFGPNDPMIHLDLYRALMKIGSRQEALLHFRDAMDAREHGYSGSYLENPILLIQVFESPELAEMPELKTKVIGQMRRVRQGTSISNLEIPVSSDNVALARACLCAAEIRRTEGSFNEMNRLTAKAKALAGDNKYVRIHLAELLFKTHDIARAFSEFSAIRHRTDADPNWNRAKNRLESLFVSQGVIPRR